MSSRKSNVTEIMLTQLEEEQVQRVKFGCELYQKYAEIKQSSTNNLELPRFGDYLHHFGFTPQSPSIPVSSTSTVNLTNAETTYKSALTSADSMSQNSKSSALGITSNENKFVYTDLEPTEHNKMLLSEADVQSSSVGPLLEINDVDTLSKTIAAPFLEPNWRQDVKSCALKKARSVYSWLCDNMKVNVNATSSSTLKNNISGSMADGEMDSFGVSTIVQNNVINSNNKVEEGNKYKDGVTNECDWQSTKENHLLHDNKMSTLNSNTNKREKTVTMVDELNDTNNNNNNDSDAVVNTTVTNTTTDKEVTLNNKENTRRRTSSARHAKKFGKESEKRNAELAAAAASTLRPMTTKDLMKQALQNRCASPEVLAMLYAVMLRAIDVRCQVVYGEIKHLDNVCQRWAWNVIKIGDACVGCESCYLVDVSTAARMTSPTQHTKKENESTNVTSQQAKKSTKDDKNRESELKAKKALSGLLNGESVLGYADPLMLLLNEEMESYKNYNTKKECGDNNDDNNKKSERSNYDAKVRNFYFTSAANVFYMSHYPMEYLSCECLLTQKEEHQNKKEEHEESQQKEKFLEETFGQEMASINKMPREAWEQLICTDYNFYAFSLQLSTQTHWRYVVNGNVAYVSVINPEPAQTELCGLLFHGSASDVSNWYYNNCKFTSNNSNSNNSDASIISSTSSSKPKLSSATSKTSSSHISSSSRKSKVQNKLSIEQSKQEKEVEQQHLLVEPLTSATVKAIITSNGPCTRCVWHEREEQTSTETFTVILPSQNTECYMFVIAARHIRSKPYSAEIITSQENKYFVPVLIYSLEMSPSSSSLLSSESLPVTCNVPCSTRFAQRHLSPSIAKMLSPLECLYECTKSNELEQQQCNTNLMYNVKDKYRFTLMPTCSNVEAVAVVVRSTNNKYKNINENSVVYDRQIIAGNDDNSNNINKNNYTQKENDNDGKTYSEKVTAVNKITHNTEEAKNRNNKAREQLAEGVAKNRNGHTDMVKEVEEEKTETSITFLPFNTETLCYDGEVVVNTCNVHDNNIGYSENNNSKCNDCKTRNGEFSAELWLLYGAPDQNGISLRNCTSTTRNALSELTLEEPERVQTTDHTHLLQERQNGRPALSARKDLRQKEQEGILPKMSKKGKKATYHNVGSTGKSGSKTHTNKTTDNYFEQKELEYRTWSIALHNGQCFRRFVSGINLHCESIEAKVSNELRCLKNSSKDAGIIRPVLSSHMEWQATLARLVGVTPTLYNETLQ